MPLSYEKSIVDSKLNSKEESKDQNQIDISNQLLCKEETKEIENSHEKVHILEKLAKSKDLMTPLEVKVNTRSKSRVNAYKNKLVQIKTLHDNLSTKKLNIKLFKYVLKQSSSESSSIKKSKSSSSLSIKEIIKEIDFTEIQNFVRQKLEAAGFKFNDVFDNKLYSLYIPSIEMKYKIFEDSSSPIKN